MKFRKVMPKGSTLRSNRREWHCILLYHMRCLFRPKQLTANLLFTILVVYTVLYNPPSKSYDFSKCFLISPILLWHKPFWTRHWASAICQMHCATSRLSNLRHATALVPDAPMLDQKFGMRIRKVAPCIGVTNNNLLNLVINAGI